LKRGTPITKFDIQSHKRKRNKEGVKGMHALGCLPLRGREAVPLSLFLKNRQHRDYLKILKNLFLHLFRIVNTPVQKEAVIDATCIKECEPGKF